MITLLIASFLAGVLTVAAPCILPLLPVIVGGSVARGGEGNQPRSWYRPLVIASSLVASLLIFSLILQASTALLGVPASVWQIISGAIVIALGFHFLLPEFWPNIALKIGLYNASNNLSAASTKRRGVLGDILIGASLGPIFSSCSPTYAFIIAAILPKSFTEGLVYLVAYAVGLAGILLVIGYGGQSIVSKLGWLRDTRSTFYKVIGVLFIAVGLSLIFGLDKKFQTYVLDQGWYDPIGRLEQRLR